MHRLLAQSLLALALLFLSALVNANTCIDRPSEIDSKVDVQKSVSKFGDLSGLVGKYKLTGFLGVFANAEVELKAVGDQFYVKFNKDTDKQVQICSKDIASKLNHVLQLKVLEPKKPENGLFLIRPAGYGRLLISANKSNWRFMKFTKVKPQEEALALKEDF